MAGQLCSRRAVRLTLPDPNRPPPPSLLHPGTGQGRQDGGCVHHPALPVHPLRADGAQQAAAGGLAATAHKRCYPACCSPALAHPALTTPAPPPLPSHLCRSWPLPSPTGLTATSPCSTACQHPPAACWAAPTARPRRRLLRPRLRLRLSAPPPRRPLSLRRTELLCRVSERDAWPCPSLPLHVFSLPPHCPPTASPPALITRWCPFPLLALTIRSDC